MRRSLAALDVVRRVNGPGIVVLGALAAAWELAVRTSLGNVRFLPAPTEIAQAVDVAVTEDDLLGRLVHTVGVTVLGWVIAGIIGLVLGLSLGVSRTLYRYSMTSFEVARSIPPITLVPAALLAFGFSLRMELVLVVFGGTWPVLINAMGGARAMSSELRDVGAMLRLTPISQVRTLVIPAALPSIVVGLRLSLSLCLVLAVVAEMVGNPAGVGNGLMMARQALQPSLMFVYVILAGLLGIVLNWLFGLLARLVAPESSERAVR